VHVYHIELVEPGFLNACLVNLDRNVCNVHLNEVGPAPSGLLGGGLGVPGGARREMARLPAGPGYSFALREGRAPESGNPAVQPRLGSLPGGSGHPIALWQAGRARDIEPEFSGAA